MSNPFFEKNTNKFLCPPFDKIKNSHYLPAFKKGIELHDKEIEDIVNYAGEPDFKNTIEAFERSGKLLTEVELVFFNCLENESDEEMVKIAKEVYPLLSAHEDNVMFNENLFGKIDKVYKDKENIDLTSEQTRLLEKIYRQFVRSGINLDIESKGRLRKINEELSLLKLEFSDNLLKDTNKYKLVINNEKDLKGLPETAVSAAAKTAEELGMKGKWVFTLKRPSFAPFVRYADNRDLRKEIYMAYFSRGNNNDENDNKETINKIINLRIELANILGYPDYASYVLDNTMAKTSKRVMDFLYEVFGRSVKKAKEELANLQRYIDKSGGGFKLEASDWSYYTEKIRKRDYNLDENEIRPYFKLENVRKGIFGLASKLYGITFEKTEGCPVYNSEVEVFDVKDEKGKHLALYMTDYYPREGKRNGAWMSDFLEQKKENGEEVRPIVYNVANLTRPAEDRPSLLNIEEVETMFHEFGHALHSMLSRCTYASMSGTNVKRDFVELPSQIMEKWAMNPEVLRTYAFHYKTGSVIPGALVNKIIKASKFNQGFATSELIAASILDMKWHMLKEKKQYDIEAFESGVMKDIGLMDEIFPRYRTTSFSHIFNSGYSAGYYSYAWAQVLDADAFSLFEKNGILDKKTAESFRKNILEKGDAEDPMVLYKKFRGKDPSPEAMFKWLGI